MKGNRMGISGVTADADTTRANGERKSEMEAPL